MAAPKASRDALDKLAAEATEVEPKPAAADGSITLLLEGRLGSAEITVLPILDWGDDAAHCLKQQDMRGWAIASLDVENLQKWIACAPTVRSAGEFFAAWELAIANAGESTAS